MREGAQPLGAVAPAELLHLVAALEGGLGGGGGGGRETEVDGSGDLGPVGGAEVGAAEGGALVPVGVDEG